MAASTSRDRISVDLRGMKPALLAQAQARGVTPSELLRALLAESLCGELGVERPAVTVVSHEASESRARLSLRMQRREAQLVLERARAAGLAPGAFVASLCGGVPAVANGKRPIDGVAALAASSAELSSLARDLRHLTQLLRRADVPAARAYRERLDDADRDVRAHLAQAAALMADLEPLRLQAFSRRNKDH